MNLGDSVIYKNAYGNLCAAIVIMTADEWVPGHWKTEEVMKPRSYNNTHFLTDNYVSFDTSTNQEPMFEGTGIFKQTWVPSTIGKPDFDRAHLKVLSPEGNDYVEYNVPFGDTPQSYTHYGPT